MNLILGTKSGDDDVVFAVPVSRLLAICPIHESNPWGVRDILRQDIQDALDNNLLCPPDGDEYAGFETDVGRVAWFVRHSWRDPISLDVGVPELGCYVDHPVLDGNHRLMTAWFRGDPHISANVCGGLQHIRATLGLEFPSVD